MKIIKSLTTTIILGSVLLSGSAFAYNAGNTDDKCLAPKFRSFSPPEHKKGDPVPEVDPESEISFTVSGLADPTTIRATAKDLPLKLDIIDRKSYYQVKTTLPAALTGKYARIHLKVKAQKGECRTKDGWLIKIKKAADVTPEAEVAPATEE